MMRTGRVNIASKGENIIYMQCEKDDAFCLLLAPLPLSLFLYRFIFSFSLPLLFLSVLSSPTLSRPSFDEKPLLRSQLLSLRSAVKLNRNWIYSVSSHEVQRRDATITFAILTIRRRQNTGDAVTCDFDIIQSSWNRSTLMFADTAI